jgi:hypothetical protein
MSQREQLENAVKESGKSISEICIKSGVKRVNYYRFIKSITGLNTNSLEKLAEALEKKIIWVDKK